MKRISLSLILILLLPTLAPAARRRAVRLPVSLVGAIKGKVVDAADGRALPNATVEFGGANSISDLRGEFVILDAQVVGSVTLSVRRAGYTSQTLTVPSSQIGAVNVALQARPAATITTLNGMSYRIDPDTLEFGYVVAFVGYTKKSSIALCKRSGEQVTVTRAQVKRIPGPTTTGISAGCCSLPAESVQIELVDGKTIEGAILDSCSGYTFDVIASDVVSGQTVYVKMKEINRLTMP